MIPKGKQGTKGQKQILNENAGTMAFYRNMIVAVGAAYFIASIFIFNSVPTLDLTLFVFGIIVLLAAYQFMASMAKPQKAPDGTLLDEGCDLNIEGGLAEHFKDLIILTSICIGLSMISTYFWLLWLFVPGRAFQMLWTNILGPWFFEPGPPLEEEVMDEKKKKRMERKMMKRYR